MVNALKVLILEDRETDQELIKRQVLKFEPKSIFTITEDKHTFYEKIEWLLPDLILADYNLPGFTGLDALVHVKEHKPFVPFVFVTGGLKPNDPVAEAVLSTADGFVLKDDIATLHIRLKEIMKSMEVKVKEHAEATQNRNQLKIKTLKAINLLQDSNDFKHKSEVLELLNGIREDLLEDV